MYYNDFSSGFFVAFVLSIIISFFIGDCAEHQGQKEALDVLSPCNISSLRTQDIKTDHWLCDNGKWVKQ